MTISRRKITTALLNPLGSFYRVMPFITCYIHKVIFHVFKKPFYRMSYNTNGNRFHCKGVLTRCKLQLGGVNNTLIFEPGVWVNNVSFEIGGNNNTLIIHRGVKWPEGGRVMLGGNNNRIEIGEDSLLVDVFLVVAEDNTHLSIGPNCMFSAKVLLRTSDQHGIYGESGKRINLGKDVIVGEHVWIGYGATILKGSVLEENSIVGTESVVAGLHLPPNSVAVGNPARIVKQGVNWKR